MKTIQELLQEARAAGHNHLALTINDDFTGSFGAHTRVAIGLPGHKGSINAELHNTTFMTKEVVEWPPVKAEQDERPAFVKNAEAEKTEAEAEPAKDEPEAEKSAQEGTGDGSASHDADAQAGEDNATTDDPEKKAA